MMVVLNQDISFSDTFNQIICFPAGSQLYVDPQTLIAFGRGLHFTLNRDEFQVIQ